MGRHGENIRKRKDGRWEGRIMASRDCNGKIKYRSYYGKSYTDVRNKLKNAQLKVPEILPDSNSLLSFTEVAHNWLEVVKDHNKYSTYIKYKGIYENHLANSFANKSFEANYADYYVTVLNHIFISSGLSKNTMSSIRNVLFQILTYGNAAGIIPTIRQQAPIPKECSSLDNEIKVFSHSEQEKLINYLFVDMDSYKLGIIICLFTGLRIGEICALQTDNIKLNKRVLEVHSTVQRLESLSEERKTELYVSLPKTPSSHRSVPLCDFLVEVLTEHMPKTKYFINGNAPMEPRTYQYKFSRYMEELGFSGYHFHTTRHTFATNCIESGMDVKCLSEILGHADVKTTLNRYVHPSMDMKIKQLNHLTQIYGQKNGLDSCDGKKYLA